MQVFRLRSNSFRGRGDQQEMHSGQQGTNSPGELVNTVKGCCQDRVDQGKGGERGCRRGGGKGRLKWDRSGLLIRDHTLHLVG